MLFRSIIDSNAVYLLATICTCSIVTGGSFTIWTHCIAIAWELPGDSHIFSYFTPSLRILLQSKEVDFEIS